MKFGWLATVLVPLMLVACGGGSSSSVDRVLSTDPNQVRDQVVAAMNGLESYRVEFDLRTLEQTTIEYKKPNSYRSLVIADDNQTGERTLGELLYVGDMLYARKCDPDGSNCSDWDSTERGDIVVGAGSPSYFPQWPIVALEMAIGFEVLQDSGSTVVLGGTVNHLRAVIENAVRLSPGTSLAEQLESQEPGLTFAEENPSRLDVWIDPDNLLIERVKLTSSRRMRTDPRLLRSSQSKSSISSTRSSTTSPSRRRSSVDVIRGLTSAIAVATIALAAACGGGSSTPSSYTMRVDDAEFVRDQVTDAMRRVASYRVDADPGGGLRYSVEYERPDSYHTSSIYDYPEPDLTREYSSETRGISEGAMPMAPTVIGSVRLAEGTC